MLWPSMGPGKNMCYFYDDVLLPIVLPRLISTRPKIFRENTNVEEIHRLTVDETPLHIYIWTEHGFKNFIVEKAQRHLIF